MDSNPPTAAARPCFGERLRAELKRLLALAIVAGLLIIAGKYYCFDRLNEEIRSRVETLLRSHYQGLSVSVKSARRIAGQGIEIRGVRIAEAGGRTAPILADIDEVFAYCDTRLPDFLTQPPQITALRIHHLKLRAERKPSGRWNIGHLLPLPSCQSAMAPVATISDSSLEIIDPAQSAGSGPSGLVLRNIELSVEPEESSDTSEMLLRIRGTVAGDHFERVEIDASLDPVSSRWDLRGAVEGLEFSPRLRAGLPKELAQALTPVSSVRGRTYFGFHIWRGPHSDSQSFETPPIQFVVHGKISEGRIDDARLPEPLTDVEATLRLDNHGVSIDGLSARCGATEIDLSAPLIGYRGDGPTNIELTARAVSLERLSTAALSTAMRQTWESFQPRGLANVTGRLRFDGRQWQPDLRIECHDLSLTYNRFPYRLTDGSGAITVKPDSATVQLRMVGGGRYINCQADVQNPGPNFTGWVQVQSEGSVAIDEKLILAMDAPTQRLVRAFHPRGNASVLARFSRNTGDTAVRRYVEINLQQGTIQHERFPYPIDRVSGLLVQDGDNWRFKSLNGRNDSAVISGEGAWGAVGTRDRQLWLRFAARDVPLADELRDALPPTAQRLWSNLRPRGTIDHVTTDLRYSTTSQQWSIEIGASKRPAAAGSDVRTIAIEPALFRYALNDVTGEIQYRDGRMELASLRAVHGRAAIAAEGNCVILPDGDCRLDLSSLAADHVDVNQELLSALPGSFGQTLGRFPLEGPVNLLGKLAVHLPSRADAPPHVTWDLKLDVENGRLLTPTPLEHIHGGVSLTGRNSAEGMFARGELNVDSAMIHGVQLTNFQGPYWCDGRLLVFGAVADRDTRHGAPRQITARVLSGLLSLDGMVVLSGSGDFDIQATLANADLTDIARQVAPHQQPPTGKVFGLVHVGGNSQGKHTWRGEGKISLREADLYELPAMIQLLKLLSVQRPDRTAFTNSNIDFRVEGDDLVFERIDFSGDAISLKGKGRMNGQRVLDVKFYPLVGREERQLAIFRPLLGQTGQEFMLIEVTGTLDQPEINRQVFPRLDGLDERLSQLFPELARSESAMTNGSSAQPTPAAFNRLWPFSRR